MTNLSLGAADVYDVLLEREDIEITESGCTSNCEICECHLFAIVNGELIKAENSEKLLQYVKLSWKKIQSCFKKTFRGKTLHTLKNSFT